MPRKKILLADGSSNPPFAARKAVLQIALERLRALYRSQGERNGLAPAGSLGRSEQHLGNAPNEDVHVEWLRDEVNRAEL